MQKLNIWAFCLALGTVWSAGTLLAGWFAALGWGSIYVAVISSIYIGYDASFWGGVIGAIWAFFDGAIFGLAISFLYNLFSNGRRKRKS